ncbi:MAG: tetratricopeptide repeat protein [Candidatus Hodarchaeota archaeon]
MDLNLKRGIELIKQVENEEAILCFEKALEFKPEDPEIHRHIGLAFFNLGNLEKALYHWRQAVEFDSSHHQTLWNLGNLYEIKQKYELAFELYSRAAHEAETAGDSKKAIRYEEWAKKVKKVIKNE